MKASLPRAWPAGWPPAVALIVVAGQMSNVHAAGACRGIPREVG
jgi:hypothetical protein